jgi:hypothetical protein
MRYLAESVRTRALAGILAVAAVGGVVTFALLAGPPRPLPRLVSADAPSAPAEAAAPLPTFSSAAAPSLPAAPAATAASARGITPAWEGTIEAILRLNVSEEQMARMLINILPTLPEEGQVEAANHITNFLPNTDYDSLRPLLLDASLPESVLSIFFADLMNRDDPTKLNAFLDIAQAPDHPFHAQALSDLQVYIGEDYGTDWPKWKSAVTQYLKAGRQ